MKGLAIKLINPLIREISGVQKRVENFKKQARDYYFEVILSAHSCPNCGRQLHMTGQSEFTCPECRNVFDPTLEFQKSNCCGTKLVRKTFHYACSRCHKTVPSRFLFDERVFDKTYFREMMKESRRKAREKREEIKRLLAESRSGLLPLTDEPNLDSIPSLFQDLDEFIENNSMVIDASVFDTVSSFRMADYRNHILNVLGWDNILFSDIEPLTEDCRRDKIWRFTTLIFMDNDRVVNLTQEGTELWVQKNYNEANIEG